MVSDATFVWILPRISTQYLELLTHCNNFLLCFATQLLFFDGQSKVTCIPVVVAIVSPFPPSDKNGINSVQRESVAIVDMKKMKTVWVRYIPLGKRAGLEQLNEHRVKDLEYCLPCCL